MAVAVITGACHGCGACILTCPERAIRPAPGAPVIFPALCTACRECEEVCPVDAITLTPDGLSHLRARAPVRSVFVLPEGVKSRR